MKQSHSRWLAGAGFIAVAALGLTGCSTPATPGGDSSDASGAPVQTVTVQAGVVPVVDVSALYLGKQQGFFADDGIDLNLNIGTSGAQIIPSVISGQYAFGFSAIVSLLQAKDNGLPVKIIAPGSASTATKGADVSMIEVGPNSTITSPKQLEGKKVAVNALNGLVQMLGSIAITNDGGDPSKVQWVELPFADELTAIQSGQIDAMVNSEPFGSAAIAQGDKVISTPYLDMSPNSLVTSAYYTSDSQLAANPDLFKRLGDAITKSLQYAAAHSDEIRSVIPQFTGLSAAQAASTILCHFVTGVPEESIALFSKYEKQYGLTKNEVAYSDVVWDQAPKS